MSRRMAALAISGLVLLLLAATLPMASVLIPIASPLGSVSGMRTPESAVEPLPEFSNHQVLSINYTANGTAGTSGVFWTYLYYRTSPTGAWVRYAPPWNPSGQWAGQLGFTTTAIIRGTIPFDTYFTGGEANYEFLTDSVDRGYWAEYDVKASTFKDVPAKARTTLDTHPPNLFVATPTPDSYTNQNLVKWAADDAVSGVAKIQIWLDDASALTSSQATGSASLSLTEGAHALVIQAIDRAGNVAQIDDPFHFDPKAPNLEITSPEPDSYVPNHDVTIRWNANDTGSDVVSLNLSLDSGKPIPLSGTTTSYTLTNLVDRLHVVSLLAQDLAGNIAAQTISFGVDTTKPSVQLVSPTEGSYSTADQLQVLWTGFDSVSGVDHYVLTLDGGRTATIPSAAGYTFPDVAEGSHAVKVQAVDRAGNAADVSAQVTVDATAPTITITSPGEGKTVSGTVKVNWTVSDAGSGVARVELLYDNTPAIIVTGAVTHDVASVSAGPHVVTIRAYDRAGNMNEAIVPFLYGTGPGGGPSGGLPALDFWILMIIIGAIAVGSAYYAVRRRKKVQA